MNTFLMQWRQEIAAHPAEVWDSGLQAYGEMVVGNSTLGVFINYYGDEVLIGRILLPSPCCRVLEVEEDGYAEFCRECGEDYSYKSTLEWHLPLGESIPLDSAQLPYLRACLEDDGSLTDALQVELAMVDFLGVVEEALHDPTLQSMIQHAYAELDKEYG